MTQKLAINNDFKPGRMLAFVEPEGDRGPILDPGPVFYDEINTTGPDISDHEFPKPPRAGLLIFEGWMECTGGPDPDVYFVGEWRPLTHWEMCRLRAGAVTLGDDERAKKAPE
jgi:hypothetical protein